jgi:serpin B
MSKLGILIAVIVCAVYLPGNSPANAQQVLQPSCTSAPAATMGSAATLAGANNDFGFRLFARLFASDARNNVLISPASAALALDMTYDGARGSTQKAMAAALGLTGLQPKSVLTSSAALLTALRSSDPHVQLTVANALWARQGVPFRQAFLRDARTYYGARVSALDFSAPSALPTINGWVKCATHGKITSIVDRIPPATVMYLMNAVYFHATWSSPFNPGQTHPDTFTTSVAQQVSVPFMVQSASFPYYASSDFQAVGLPYGSGRFEMVVILPRQGFSLETLARQLGNRTWGAWTSHLQPAQVDLSLPRFSLTESYALNQALKKLGMGIAFAPSTANLSGLCPETAELRCSLSDVRQKTYLQVEEKGTTAAAATSVGVIATAARRSIPMTVNRPFFLAIQDRTTGAILFFGAVRKPS